MPVALILVDALSASYIALDMLPASWKVGRGGYAGPMANLYAFRGIEATLFTGLSPDEHGVWGEFRPSELGMRISQHRVRSTQYAVRSREPMLEALARGAISAGDLLPSDRLRLDARYLVSKVRNPNHHLPTGNLIPPSLIPYFKGSVETPIWEYGTLEPFSTIFDEIRDAGMSFEIVGYPTVQHDGQIVERVRAKAHQGRLPDFWYIKFSALDALGHKYGPSVARLRPALDKLNGQLQEVISELERAYADEGVDIVVLGDHGMSAVRQTLDVRPILKRLDLVPGRDFLYFLDSTTIRFWSDSPRVCHILAEAFGNLAGMRVLDGYERQALAIPYDAGTGDVLVALDEGRVVFPDFFRRSGAPRGMHGYADVRTVAGLPALAVGREVAGLLPGGRTPAHADVWTAMRARLGFAQDNVVIRQEAMCISSC